MKRIILIVAALSIIAGCNAAPKKVDLQEAFTQIVQNYQAIYQDTTLTEAELDAKALDYLKKEYNAHKKDSIGLELFTTLAAGYMEPAEAISLYDKSSKLIKNDEQVIKLMETLGNYQNTSAGKPFVEVSGVDAITGATVALSQYTHGDKPLLVDFWASWCRPCRNEISSHLIPLYASGAVDIIGIAVWEKSEEDTQAAMQALGIPWPVIFCGGREDSPTTAYGITGIPTILRIENGVIVSRGHSTEDVGF